MSPKLENAEKFSVGFLFDKSNPWIYRYISEKTWLKLLYKNYNFNEFWSTNNACKQDILFILGYTKILPTTFLNKNRFNLVIHESNLPEGRGFSPVQWQILKGINKIPVLLLEATKDVDEGDIYGSTYINLQGHELFEEIREAQADATKTVIKDFLTSFPKIEPIPQTGEASYFRKRNRIDDKLDLNLSISKQFNKLRVANNEKYPCYFEMNGYKYELKIKKIKNDD